MEEKRRKKRQPQLSLILRVGCGVYLLYLSGDLGGAALAEERRLLFASAAIFFALIGASLCTFSVRALVRGEFLRPGENDESEAGSPEKGDTEHGQD